jgi:urease beta subunit
MDRELEAGRELAVDQVLAVDREPGKHQEILLVQAGQWD